MVAKSKAELMRRLRAERKAAGLCPCCGQHIPKKDTIDTQKQSSEWKA